jgi:ribosomal protein S18 acetylase RimI-like enzyme
MWERPDQVPLMMDLWVAPRFRRRGVGKSIVRSLEEAARARGFRCVYLQVEAEKNRQAVQIYERMGYEKLEARRHKDLYAEVDEAGTVHEREEVILDMRKWL